MRGVPLLIGALVVVAAACGDDGQASDHPPSSVTLGGVGVLPPTLSGGDPTAASTVAPDDSTDSSSEADDTTDSGLSVASSDEPPSLAGAGAIGDVADGNRVLIIGDSLLASTAVRHGGSMCQRLVPLGWAVAVEAEQGRHIGFGNDVLDARLAEDWDVAVVMLGNNYDLDQVAFESELTGIVDRLSPRPILLFTVTEFDASRIEVNESIRRVAALHQNVRTAEWASITATDTGLLSGDGLHPSETGRARLVEAVASDLGLAPTGSTGECLASTFNG